MNRLHKVALACACALASTGTFAAAQSSASISDLTFQVIDLDLSDGYSFQFNNTGRTLLSLSASNGITGESDSYSRNRQGWLVPSSFDSQLDPVSASATVSATGIDLHGESLGPGNYSASASSGNDYYWYYGGSPTLTLSARTMVVITGTASVSASATNPESSGCWYYCSPSESASASVSMSLNYSYATGNTSMSYSFNESLNANAAATGAYTRQDFVGYELVPYYYWGGYTYYDYVPIYRSVDVPMTEETNSQEKTFTAVFVNSSDFTQSASFYLSASISGSASTPLQAASFSVPVTPVPEPETWALAVAGLLLVGARARRLRQQA